MHPAKRRRMDNAGSALTRPFRSPLHVDLNKWQPSPEKQDDPVLQAASEHTTPLETGQTQQSPPSSSSIAPSTPPMLIRPWHQSSISQNSPRRSSRLHLSNYDEDYIALQKQHSALALQLKDLSASLDIASQALKIVQSGKDANLVRLVSKWRATSRDAAEELFSTAKDRVNCMGGVGVWREKYTKPAKQHSWNDESEVDEDALTDEQKERRDIAREEARLEAEKYGLDQNQPVSTVDDDDSFTMDMMLKQLNVDLEAIGYDAQAQQWAD